MPHVSFTQNLQRHVACPPDEAVGRTVREVLEGYFQKHPEVRGYVLDDQGGLRPHMVIFIGGEMVRDRLHLTDSITSDMDVHVLQALSGG